MERKMKAEPVRLYIHTWPVLTYAQQWEIRFHIWRLYVLRENDADYDAWRAWTGLP